MATGLDIRFHGCSFQSYAIQPCPLFNRMPYSPVLFSIVCHTALSSFQSYAIQPCPLSIVCHTALSSFQSYAIQLCPLFNRMPYSPVLFQSYAIQLCPLSISNMIVVTENKLFVLKYPAMCNGTGTTSCYMKQWNWTNIWISALVNILENSQT
jgi:hypothetical protein